MPDGGDGDRARALERLTGVSRALTNTASVDEVLDIAVDTARELLDAPRAVLMLRDEDGLLRVRAARGVEPEQVERFREPLDETLTTRLNALFGPAAEERFLGVPLVVRDRVMGLLAVLQREVVWETRDEWLLAALADQVSVGLERARPGEPDLERRLRELEAEEARREEALRIMGHDMRSPLSSLLGYLHLLGAETFGPVTDSQRAAIERLEAIAEHLESLVSTALEMGQLAAGRIHVECGPVQVRPVLEAALGIVELRAQAADVALQLDAPDDLVARAEADRLRQVLIQLLDNAIKFSPAEGTIRIRAAREAGPPDRVVIRVSDDGPGIERAHSDHIFEPYRRLGDETGGFGLGLSLARAVTELMDGELLLEDHDAPGATFAVRLPAS